MSGVGEIVGVVSFVIQVSGLVQKTSHVLKSTKNAPAEIERLAESLVLLDHCLCRIKAHIDRQILFDGSQLPAQGVEQALKGCENTMKRLSEHVNRIQNSFDSRDGLRGRMATLKFAVKNDDISRYTQQVREDISLLHMACSIDFQLQYDVEIQIKEYKLNCNSIYQSQFPFKSEAAQDLSQIGTTLHIGRQDGRETTVAEDESLLTRNLNKSCRLSLRKASTTFYRLPFVEIDIERNTACASNTLQEKFVTEKSVISIRPCFLSRMWEIRYCQSIGQIARTLVQCPVLHHESPIFEACRSGQSALLREELTVRRISPHVRDERGRPLLYWAVIGSQVDICLQLLQLQVSLDHVDPMGFELIYRLGMCSKYRRRKSAKDTAEVMRLLISAQDHLTAWGMSRFLTAWPGPPEPAAVVYSQRHLLNDPVAEHSLRCVALRLGLRRYGQGKYEWNDFIRQLLHSSVSIHELLEDSPMSRHRATPLGEIFQSAYFPGDGHVASRGWLSLLTEESFDYVSYLREEEALQLASNGFSNPLRKLVFLWGEHPSVTWDWYIPTSTPGSLVCFDLRHMNMHHDEPGLKSWEWEAAWPFVYPDWFKPWYDRQCYRSIVDHSCDSERTLRTWQDAHMNEQMRFAARTDKKLKRQQRAQGLYRPMHVPGSWI